jgi:formylglycine-generating enzyme required for sulfatase activity
MPSVRSLRSILALLAISIAGSAHAQKPPAPQGEKYAILVGVRQYESPDLHPMKFAENDVEQLSEILLRSGYRPENVKLMTQTAGVANLRFLPVSSKVNTELDLTLKHLDEADSVVVALAGHGVQFRAEEEAYFCPADARLDKKETLVPLGKLYDSLSKCKAGFKLLLVDACRNNALTELGRDAGRPVVSAPSLSRPLKKRPAGGVAALFSCSTGEKAYELPDLGHGVFFHFVIRGLEGEADADGDGKIDLAELTSFTTRQVYRTVENKLGVEQNPEFVGKSNAVSIVKVELRKVITSSIGMKLVLVPAGQFMMGVPEGEPDANDNEKPQHRVRITKPFYLGAHEVTQREYRGMMGANPSICSTTGPVPDAFRGQNTDSYPVENISWFDAVSFCNKLSEKDRLTLCYTIDGERVELRAGSGYRLPTEAEWEYACRAGTETPFAFGPRLSPTDANFDGNETYNGSSKGQSLVRSTTVGSYRPNAFGLYDMHGNVFEWCWDGYDANAYAGSSGVDPVVAPSGAAERVYRGGAWGGPPQYARSAVRGWHAPTSPSGYLGFRVARVR